MSYYVINKSEHLQGDVCISGAKNAILPIMAATILTEETCEILDVPDLEDVKVMVKILEHLGLKVTFDKKSNLLKTKSAKRISYSAPHNLVERMRASILVMGPLLARKGKVKVALPGGCAIGGRPIDLHLKGLQAMGATIEVGEAFIEATGNLKGAQIYLDFPSVGATENLIMAATLAEGTTILENSALEPEIVDLANFLNKMGAKIKGAGTDTIKIEGVKALHGAKHAVIPDRVEAATFMLLAAITRGNIFLKNALSDHVRPIMAKLLECGVEVIEEGEGLRVKAEGKLKATQIKTFPYPGFPTDVQPQFMAFLATVEGTSEIIETVFENRYMHIEELNKMGANIVNEGKRARVIGIDQLKGATVRATDLRAGAALVMAGCMAENETKITDIYHIERGYSIFIDKLRKLGVSIEKKH